MMPIEYCCFDFNASSKSPANKRPLFISRAIINYNPWQQSEEVNAYKLSDNMALVPGLLILNPTFTKLPGPSAAIFETRMFCFIDPENVIFFSIICSREIHGSPSINISIQASIDCHHMPSSIKPSRMKVITSKPMSFWQQLLIVQQRKPCEKANLQISTEDGIPIKRATP